MQEETLKTKNPVKSDVTQIDLMLNTIVFLIGPSGCGKTFFTENKLIPELKAHGDNVKVHHIASDEIRRELLDDNTLAKKDFKMMYASKPAFELLNARVKALTSYPVNADFIVIDSTGLSKDFRNSIKTIADDNNYNIAIVMFDYKGRGPYYEFLSEDEESKAVTSRQLKYMRENVFAEVSKKTFRNITKIKSHDLENYKVNITNYDRYQECILPEGFDYVTIGDIHGCYDEFVALLEKNDFTVTDGKIVENVSDKDYDPKRIVLVGDLVDKGYNVRGVIELVHNNLDLFYLVEGNHERFVYRYLRHLDGDENSGIRPKDLPTQEFMDEYFDSIELFKNDDELKAKFYEICEKMKPFLKANHFVVTHAPCDQKYLAKLGASSERNQRTIVYPKGADFDTVQDYMAAKSKFFTFFRNQASRSLPTHLFGHVSTRGIARRANKVNLDSGCVAGGRLSSIIVSKSGNNLMRGVPATNENIVKKDLHDFFFTPPPVISIDTLEGRERGRIFYASEAGVNFVSGTICPADKILAKDEKKNTILADSVLESLDKGIEYFRKNGVTQIMAQPKYMGSRANIYLFKNPEKNYTTTRQGYIVKPENLDLTEAYKPLYELPFIKKAFKSGTDMFILDSELLPWSSIGKGLIEKNFVTVDKAVTSEIDFLKDTGFEEALDEIVNGSYKDCDFETIAHKTSRKDLIELIGSHNERTFRAIKDYIREFPDLSKLKEFVKIYSRQIELYGSEGTVHFKPFSILKQVFTDGTEKLFFDESNEDIYKAINSDNYIVVNLDNEEEIEALRAFYNKTTIDDEMEGIMLKPLTVYVKGVVPAMKVRNPRYLTIIYGPDYLMDSKLEKLINRKKVRRKLSVSVSEWEIGKRLLEIPYNRISKENPHYIQAYGEMVVEERNERELDPRL